MTITSIYIKEQIEEFNKKIKEEKKILNDLKRLQRLKDKHMELQEQNKNLYNRIYNEEAPTPQEETTTQEAPTIEKPSNESTIEVQPTPTPKDEIETITQIDETNRTEETKEEEEEERRQPVLEEEEIEEEEVEDEDPPLGIVWLEDCDETDDLDGEEEDEGEPTEDWVDLGIYSRKCIIKGIKIYTRVSYREYNSKGRRYEIPKNTMIGWTTTFNKEFKKLYIDNRQLEAYKIIPQAFTFLCEKGDLTRENPYLCKFNFKIGDFINKGEFTRQLHKPMTSLRLYETHRLVEYPLPTHPHNGNLEELNSRIDSFKLH